MTVTIETVPGVPVEPPGVGSGADPTEPTQSGGRLSAAGNWAINVRDRNLRRQAEIDDFQRLELLPRFNDIGTWLIDLDATANPGVSDALLEPGAGIICVRGERTIVSGPARVWRRKRSPTEDRLIVGGFTDEYWLGTRLVSPQPASSSPPYNATAYDTRTGVASTIMRQYVDVNAASGAIAPRRVTGLTVEADPVIGASVTGRGRWQELVVLLQELALAADLGFRVIQSGETLLFRTYQPVDASATIVLSEERGTLAGFEYELAVPDANYVYVGDVGEGTARGIREIQDADSIARYWRAETFRDARDTSDVAVLAQRGDEVLAEKAAKFSIKLTTIDMNQAAYLIDYDLGDKIAAIIDGERYSEVVREIAITFTPDQDVVVRPTIATPGRNALLRIVDAERRLIRSLRDLERR